MSQAGQTNSWGIPMKGGNSLSALGRGYGAGGGGGTWIGDTPPQPDIFIAVGGENGGGQGGGFPGLGNSWAYRLYANQGSDTEGGGGGGGGDPVAWGYPNIPAYGYGARGGNGQVRLRYPNPQRLSGGTGWNGGDGYFYHEFNSTTNFTTYAG